MLELAKHKIRKGEKVEVKLQKENSNSIDAIAITFMYNTDDRKRKGCVVVEALSYVYDALAKNNVCFCISWILVGMLAS